MRLLIALFILVYSSIVSARWTTKEDMSFQANLHHTSTTVNQDGSYQIDSHMEFLITQESGKEYFSNFKIKFDMGREKMQVTEAYVKNDDGITKIDGSRVKIASLANQGQGFDAVYELAVSFPALKVGSVIVLKLQKNVNKHIIENYFNESYNFGNNFYSLDTKHYITAPFPLYLTINDPDSLLKIEEKKIGNTYAVELKAKSPFIKIPTQENTYLPRSKKTYVDISSANNWSNIAVPLKRLIEERLLVEKIPVEIENWIREAKVLKSPTEVVDFFVSNIIENLTYMGDWRTIEGALLPKGIDYTWTNKSGDCKDFSLLLTFLLKKVGLNANMALVRRSMPYDSMDTSETSSKSLNHFNHAIVNLHIDGKDYWIDPTNTGSFGLNHRFDISNKMSLVLDAGPSHLKNIPFANAEDNFSTGTKTYDFTSLNDAKVHAVSYSKGESAALLTGVEHRISKSQLKDLFMSFIAMGEKFGTVNFKDFDFTKRKYQDVNIDVTYNARSIGDTENKRKFLIVPTSSIIFHHSPYTRSEDEIGDLYLSSPLVTTSKTIYNGISAIHEFPENCYIRSPWYSGHRVFTMTEQGIEVDEKLVINQPIIKNEFIQSADFITAGLDLKSCLGSQQIFYKIGTNSHEVKKSNLLEMFKEQSLADRLKNRVQIATEVQDSNGDTKKADYTAEDAIELMKANIKESPEHFDSYMKLAYLYLHQGYLNGDKFNSVNIALAIKTINEALVIFPEHPRLHINLANFLLLKKDNEKAKEIYDNYINKVDTKDYYQTLVSARVSRRLNLFDKALDFHNMTIENAANDKDKYNAYFERAIYFGDIKKYKECAEDYKLVIENQPTNFWAHFNITTCLARTKKYDEAVSYAKKGYEMVGTGMSESVYSYALFQRGQYRLKKSRFKEAAEDLSLSFDLDPNQVVAAQLISALIQENQMNEVENIVEEVPRRLPASQFAAEHFYVEIAKEFEHSDLANYAKYILKARDVTESLTNKMLYVYKLLYLASESGQFSKFQNEGLESMEIGNKHLKSSPEDLDILIHMGSLQIIFSKHHADLTLLDSVSATAEKILAIDPNNKNGLYFVNYVKKANKYIGRDENSKFWQTKLYINSLTKKYLNVAIIAW